MKIAIEDRFTDLEIARMFSLDCNPSDAGAETRVRYHEEKYCFNDIKVPLWTIRKRKQSQRVGKYGFDQDNVKPGITNKPPGSDRVADLAKFYAENPEDSPFKD